MIIAACHHARSLSWGQIDPLLHTVVGGNFPPWEVELTTHYQRQLFDAQYTYYE